MFEDTKVLIRSRWQLDTHFDRYLSTLYETFRHQHNRIKCKKDTNIVTVMYLR